MSDFRRDFFNDFKTLLSQSNLSKDDMFAVSNILLTTMDKYEIVERCTEVATVEQDFESILKVYIATIITAGKSKRTAKTYASLIKRFMNDVNKPLRDIIGIDIMIWLSKQDVTPSTTKNYRNYLSAFFTWCFKQKIISDNPIYQTEQIKVAKTIKDSFSKIEVDRLRVACRNVKQRAIVEFLLASGVRNEEFCNVMLKDVNFQELEVLVRKGKGNKDRKVYINELCAYHLRKYLSTRKDNDGHLFVTRFNEGYTVSGLGKLLNVIGKNAEVADCHAHKFRHTFADMMTRSGMDIRTLQILMGHSNINTTMGYISINNEFTHNEYRRYA